MPDILRIFLSFFKKIFKLKTRKSAGVRVTPAVHSFISQGNSHRDVGDWPRAAAMYRNALDHDPGLVHIWVQLGHMLKESRNVFDACDAYLSAFVLRPDDHALLGWLYGIAGSLPSDRRRGLMSDIDRMSGLPPRTHIIAPTVGHEPAENQVIFDVSDLIAYFTRARRPTGIQRVQIEIINAALDEADGASVRICCSIEESAHWVEINTDLFRSVTRLAINGNTEDDALWREAIGNIQAALIFGADFIFGPKARLINLGTSWWLRNYFLQVRNAQVQHGVEYIPFIHDLIPVLAPHHCVQGLVDDFNSWILGVFDHADRFLANSIATKHDLLHVARMLGRPIDDQAVTVIPLDGAFAGPDLATPSGYIRDLDLDSRSFVLFVSTIESRKGHLVALRAWQRILKEHGGETPYLVCVGNNGWLNQEFYQLLDEDSSLKDRVILLSGISDMDLAFLYRACLFTIYPSTYEGWGLPITEALTCGKIVVTANNSSLPQAGGEFAVYTRTGDDEDLAAHVAHFSFNKNARQEKERDIRLRYRPRPWSAIARQIIDAAKAPRLTPTRDLVPMMMPGEWMDMRRACSLSARAGAGSAERLRFGTGWTSPDTLGCWIKEGQAELRFSLPASQLPGQVALRLYGKTRLQWQIDSHNDPVIQGETSGADEFWAIYPIHAEQPFTLRIEVKSAAEDEKAPNRPILGVRGCIALPRDHGRSQDLIRAITAEISEEK